MRLRRLVLGAILVMAASKLHAQRLRPRPDFTAVGLQRKTFSKDREEIQRFFSSYQGALPPGLDRREQLPPGVQKQLVRNGELPQGLEQEMQPLPRSLDVKLSVLDVAWRRGYIDGKVVTWDRKSRRVVDIIEVH